MEQEEKGIERPEELIALKKAEGTLVRWRPVPGAVGYNIYARSDEAADGNYSAFQYVKLNHVPVDKPEYHDISRCASYRVTAVDRLGNETDFSDMVFPVTHEGVEILSIRYFSGKGLLLRLPASAASVRLTAINSSRQEEAVILKVYWDGRHAEFPLILPCDGLLHEYTAEIGEVICAPVAAEVHNREGKLISCVSKFRPEGKMLYDTLFEKGLLVCEPQTETMYDETVDGAVAEEYLKNGRIFGQCHIQFELSSISGQEAPFMMELGKISLMVTSSGRIEVCSGGERLGECDYTKAVRNLTHSALGTAELTGSAAKSMVLHVFAGSDTLQIFLSDGHIPALTVETKAAQGPLRFVSSGWEVKGLRIVSQKASFAGVLPLGCENPDPVWNIACWWSRFNWIRDGKTDAMTLGKDGSLTVSNPGRSLSRSAKGDEVVLQARGSMEYEHTRRRDEGWTHLLLEVLWDRPELGRIAISELKSLWLTMDIRLLQCENKTSGYEADIHAGQFVVYFNISGARNEAMWLGLCNMDSRFLMDENRQELVCQMDPGTNTFIIAPPQTQFITGHLADGQWHSMSIDLKPVILQAYEHGKSIGAFAGSSFEQLLLNSMNLGFEIPGSFDMAVKLSNMQLAALR